ncbi:cytochrome P450 [Streptomyces sp. WMMC500]|uniref:cytochrome P450 n=1 Tax=Streptomyces sp. WMMC500 TaxID=3015154 RepID=UPI00248C5846|nr:cytochrome P450 [Streptomyces sp. WMMC500]WBB64356.1 cytochrome P450 [Streptomyces sp. WMMC500]
MHGPEAASNPYGLYEKLRAEHGAVAPVLVHGDLPAWLVLGYRELLDVTRNPTRFSRDSRHWRFLRDGQVGPDNPLLPLVTWVPMCSFVDGSEHRRLRSAVTDSMKRFDRHGIRRHVTRFSGQLVDEFAATGRADLVSQFAEHLPMLVMTKALGMAESYGPQLVEAARDMVKGSETAIASNEYIVQTLRDLVARKKSAPGHDFASWLVAHDSGLGDDELVEHLRLVLIAAYSTTANLIANTLRMVLTDSRFRGNLAGGHMTLPDALEQVLWDEPPFTAVYGRYATGDTELAGQQIKAGDLLILGLAAGNLDPEIRPDLDVPVHGNRSHLAFSGGPHECPGQDIGRAIADTGIDTLLGRLPDLSLAVEEKELKHRTSLLSRELVELPVTFTPPGPGTTAASGEPGAAVVPGPSVPANGTPAPAAAERVPAAVASASPPGPEATAPEPEAHAGGLPAGARTESGRRRRPSLWRTLVAWWRGY